ncbi:MAG: carbohydrate kinase family protein, partial [Candidatus Thorarchaeota archaeon]
MDRPPNVHIPFFNSLQIVYMKCSKVHYIVGDYNVSDANDYLKMLGMTEQETTEPLWPYLLFLPSEQDTRDEFVRTVLSSRVARSVLSGLDKEGPVMQKELVASLPHSNKSVLSYLSILRKFGLITTGSTIHLGRRVVFHDLTKSGWGLAKFFFEGLPSDIEEFTASLLEDYLTRLATLYRAQGIPESTLFEIVSRMKTKAILEGSKAYSNPSFILFGAAAFNTEIECGTLPVQGGLASCSPPNRHPGGSTVDLALALAKEGFETSLVSSVGNDMDGRNIITNLIQGNIDVRHIVVEDDKHTNKSIIIKEGKKGTRTFVAVSPTTALSITSPNLVPWSHLDNSKVVYIGEVFVEVAAAIAAHTNVKGIPTVYRCSVPYLEFGLEHLKPVLSQVGIILISNRGWKYLKANIGSRPLQKLRELTDAAIIIKQSKNKYQLSISGGKNEQYSCDNDSTDITERFTAGLMMNLTESEDIVNA